MADQISNQPETAGIDLTNLKPAKPPSIEDDPNHQLRKIIARRTEKPAEPETAEEKPKEGDTVKSSGEEKTKLRGLISKALKFPEKKEAEKKAPETAETTPEGKKEKKEAEQETPEKPEKPTIVRKRKTEAAIDPVKIATETAAATAREVAKEFKASSEKREEKKPENTLEEDDLHEYEVARFLASTDAKFKDAPDKILAQVNQAARYAQRWETNNPGKTFNPEDEEHDAFYESLQKPWSEREFRKAEIAMEAEKIAEKKLSSANAKLEKLDENDARMELAPTVERAVLMAADHMAREIGAGVHETIIKNGFDKLTEQDPETANVLAESIGAIQPLVEAIVQIDDPKFRIKFDEKKPEHQQWLKLLIEKERQYSGQTHEGKMFATRRDYSKMTAEQRASHWYLTADDLLSEAVKDATASAVERIKSEKERLEKFAARMGYVKKEPEKKSDPSNNGGSEKSEASPSRIEKPVSPSAGSGVKIDAKGEPQIGGNGAFLKATHSILFPTTERVS